MRAQRTTRRSHAQSRKATEIYYNGGSTNNNANNSSHREPVLDCPRRNGHRRYGASNAQRVSCDGCWGERSRRRIDVELRGVRFEIIAMAASSSPMNHRSRRQVPPRPHRRNHENGTTQDGGGISSPTRMHDDLAPSPPYRRQRPRNTDDIASSHVPRAMCDRRILRCRMLVDTGAQSLVMSSPAREAARFYTSG